MEKDRLTASFIIGHRYGVGVANAISLVFNNKKLNLDIGIAACLHPKHAIVTGGYSDPRIIFQEHKIPYILFDNVNEEKVESAMRGSKPNIIFVCGLRQIIRNHVLEIPAHITKNKSLYGKRHGVIGFHPGFLPDNPGASPVQWAIISKTNCIGLSAFFMEGKGIDSGPIIATKTLALPEACDAKQLNDDISVGICELLQKIFMMLFGGLTYTDQAKANLEQRRFSSQLRPIDSWLDFTRSSEELVAIVRAFTLPYRMAYFIYMGHVVFVKYALSSLKGKKGKEGEVLQYQDGVIDVQCSKGVIHLYGLVSTIHPLSFNDGDLLN